MNKDHLEKKQTKGKIKTNIHVLVTAGPTREPIDAVRYISNIATGKLGVEIAKEAYKRGYSIHLLYDMEQDSSKYTPIFLQLNLQQPTAY